MEQAISINDNMERVARKVNDGFAAIGDGFEVIDQQDSMEVVAGKLSRNFAKVTDAVGIQQIVSTDSMSGIANKLESNFDIVDDIVPEAEVYSFLHCSDPHGRSIDNMLSTLGSDNNISFGIISGDLKAYGVCFPGYKSDITSRNGRLVVVAGNHDSVDKWETSDVAYDQSKMTAWLYEALGGNVNWGDTDGNQNIPIVSSYWYKDFGKLRVIGIDQYDFSKIAAERGWSLATTRTHDFNVVYSQAQIQWLANLLANTDSSYHVVIAIHDAPSNYVKPSEIYDNGEYVDEALFYRYTSASIFSSQGNIFTGGTWLPNIVKAWMSRQSATITQGSTIYTTTGSESYTASVQVDFSQMEGAGNFVGYLCGHQHYDFTYWLDKVNFPSQLVMLITAGDARVGYNYDSDLLIRTGDYTYKKVNESEPDYRYNKVTYNPEAKTVQVERIGQKTAANRDTLVDLNVVDGVTATRVRDKLLFNLRTMEATRPAS